MDAKGQAHQANYKNVTVKLKDGTVLNGKVNIYPKTRISEVFASKDKTFVIIVEGGAADIEYQTIVVNKKEVVWAEPEEIYMD